MARDVSRTVLPKTSLDCRVWRYTVQGISDHKTRAFPPADSDRRQSRWDDLEACVCPLQQTGFRDRVYPADLLAWPFARRLYMLRRTGSRLRWVSEFELQAALEAAKDVKPRVVHDHGSEFVNRDVAAVIKTHNLIDIKTKPRHPESNGIVERFNGTVRNETNNDYGDNYLQAEAIIAKLMQHYNEERLHASLGYMTPATWHRGQPDEVRDERARRIAAARAHRRMTNQQRFTEAA